MEKAHAHGNERVVPAFGQTLSLNPPGFGTTGRLAVDPRVDTTEGPSLAVLGRGGPVRVKDVALIQQSVDDLLDLLLRSHDARLLASGNKLSSVSSKPV